MGQFERPGKQTVPEEDAAAKPKPEEIPIDPENEMAELRGMLADAEAAEAHYFAVLEKLREDEQNGEATINSVQAATAEYAHAKRMREEVEKDIDEWALIAEKMENEGIDKSHSTEYLQ